MNGRDDSDRHGSNFQAAKASYGYLARHVDALPLTLESYRDRMQRGRAIAQRSKLRFEAYGVRMTAVDLQFQPQSSFEHAGGIDAGFACFGREFGIIRHIDSCLPHTRI